MSKVSYTSLPSSDPSPLLARSERITAPGYESREDTYLANGYPEQYGEEKPTTYHHWFGWGLAILLLIAAVIFFILWLTKEDEKKELAVNGVQFKLEGQNSLNATWTSTALPADKISLYASVGSLTFNSAGIPSSTSNDLIDLVYQVGPVDATAKTITLANLPFNTRLNAALVVTNTDKVKGFRQYNHQFHTLPALVPIINGDNTTSNTVSSANPNSNLQDGDIITLSDISQKGSLRLDTEGDIKYNQVTVSKSSNDVFLHDQGVLCMASTAKHHRHRCKPSRCGSRSDVLHDNNGVVALGRKEDLDEDSYTWVYNSQGRNRWCLRSDNTRCMSYAQGFDEVPMPISVNVNNSGSTWTNPRVEQ